MGRQWQSLNLSGSPFLPAKRRPQGRGGGGSTVFSVLFLYQDMFQGAYEMWTTENSHKLIRTLFSGIIWVVGGAIFPICIYLFRLDNANFDNFKRHFGYAVLFGLSYIAFGMILYNLVNIWAGFQAFLFPFVAVLIYAFALASAYNLHLALVAAIPAKWREYKLQSR